MNLSAISWEDPKVLVPAVLVGAGLVWWLTANDEDDEEGLEEITSFSLEDFGPDFDPSTWAFSEGEFGFLGMSKRQRRDRKRRYSQRKMDSYKKCVEKKGKRDAACKRKLKKAKRALQRARRINRSLGEKGKTTAARVRRGQLQTKAAGSKKWVAAEKAPTFKKGKSYKLAKGKGKGKGKGTGPGEDDEMYDEEGAGGGGGGALLALGAIALLGGGGFAIYKLMSKPKKKRRKKKPTAKKPPVKKPGAPPTPKPAPARAAA